MLVFEVDVAEWNLSWNISKRLGFGKLVLAHAICYILKWKLLFSIVVSWEWHLKGNQEGQFHSSRVEGTYILPFLQKWSVNMARFRVYGNQKFASFSGWQKGITPKFSGLTVRKVSIPIIEAILPLKQFTFWNVGCISEFVDWNVQRDASTLVQGI